MIDPLGSNPDALPGAPAPRTVHLPINGTTIYVEVRGSGGPPVLIIPAGGEDAELYRPVAERLSATFTVLTYDRRGSLRSGREGWPGGGSRQHADDAAGLLLELGGQAGVVFGASTGGIAALQLALHHPQLIRRALVYEPGYLRYSAKYRELIVRANDAAERHLASNPEDWFGAMNALGRAALPDGSPADASVFDPPRGREWYAERVRLTAEAFIRDDMPLTEELFDEALIESADNDIRFAHGTDSPPFFAEICRRLAGLRGATPSVVRRAGHVIYFHPEAAAEYILAQAA